jgi:hypothetical protein
MAMLKVQLLYSVSGRRFGSFGVALVFYIVLVLGSSIFEGLMSTGDVESADAGAGASDHSPAFRFLSFEPCSCSKLKLITCGILSAC